ncbi:MAG: flavin reductase [Oceanobacter sp.]
MIDIEAFRNGMSLLGGAVSIITTDGEAGKFGFTATAVTSVTAEPPTLLVCMNRNSYANEHFKKNEVLCVNVLAGAHQQLSGDFANPQLTSEERFKSHDWSVLTSGAPALDEALVNFDCRIADMHEVGSHTVFYCHIVDARQSGSQEALVYFNRAYHCLHEGSVAG